jgi:hypothetical protein
MNTALKIKVVTENSYTFEEEIQMLKDSNDTESHIKFKSVKSLLKYLDK